MLKPFALSFSGSCVGPLDIFFFWLCVVEYKFWLEQKKNKKEKKGKKKPSRYYNKHTHTEEGGKSISIELNNQQGRNYLLLTFILQKRQGIIWW